MSGWRDSAACLGYDPEIFFPKPKDVMAIRKAQEVCSGCPVIKQCGRWWKLDHVSPYLSIWSPVPKWLVWLRWHKQWKTERKSVE